jgi:DNA-binding transcriptional LysR family regulator
VYESLRHESVVALIGAMHPLARANDVELAAFRDEEFVMFPRELAPRLHDILVGACRSSGFEPTIRAESFHSGWELQTLADVPAVTLAPASVAGDLPSGVVARGLGASAPRLETMAVCRADDRSSVVRTLRDVATSAFPATSDAR